MRTRLSMAMMVTVLVILALLMPVGVAAADPGPGQGPPFDSWMPIVPGQTHVYRFSYNYDNSKEGNEPTQALVILTAVDNTRSVNFVVHTAATLALPKLDEDGKYNQPLGAGSPMNAGEHHEDGQTETQNDRDHALMDEHGMFQDYSHYVWSSATPADETYFVYVTNKGAGPGMYKLLISGPDVTIE